MINKDKSFFNPESLDACITWCKISGKPYRVIVSNYTTAIEGHLNIKFVKNEKSLRCFSAFQKIKSDIIKSNIHIDLDKSEINYFESELSPAKYKQIYNVDLKSAYATILKNDKLITAKTFRYLSKLPKEDRLACVGMTASHKYIFDYLGKEIINFDEDINDLENYFYYCVKRTFEVMMELKKICGDSYLFCWVDSVYYTDKSKTAKLIKYLTSVNFKCSFEVLKEAEVIELNNHFKIKFKKNGKLKPFCIPKSEGSFYRQVIAKHLRHIR